MSQLTNNLKEVLSTIPEKNVTLVAVSKTKPIALIQEAYDAGQRHFGENKVQELAEKAEAMPKDIHWHIIGHLQTNKVKYIAPFVYLIHSVDSIKLLKEINKQAAKNDRIINVLLQMHIAAEETKFGFDKSELMSLFKDNELSTFENVKVEGLMGMATFTDNEAQIRHEFNGLNEIYNQLTDQIKSSQPRKNAEMSILSMGMSGDYKIAIEEGSNMVRIGTTIFGDRNY
jgi:pyridoxal phosphate enzyme (YggS family)